MAVLQFIPDAEFLLKGAARLEGTKTEVGRHLYACDRARRASRRVSDIFGLECLLTFLGLHSYYKFPPPTPTRSDHSSVTQCCRRQDIVPESIARRDT